MRSFGARLVVGAASAALVLCAACPPFPAGECDGEEDCPTGSVCDQALRLCVSTDPGGAGGDSAPIWIEKVFAPHHPSNQVYPGDRGLQLEVKLWKEDDRPIEVHAIELLVDRDGEAFSWVLQQPLPRTLSGIERKVIWVYAALAPDLAPGDLVVDAYAYVYDPETERAERVGPAREPLVLHVTERPLAGAVDDPDADGDGLSREVEAALGLDPNDPDSDGDGVDDDDELTPMGIPVDSDADGTPDALDEDSDGGGEPDLLEAFRGGDLTSPDDDVQFSPLVVTTAVDEEAPDLELSDPSLAGELLSLREAIIIANNRRGPDHITFAPHLIGQPVTVSFRALEGWSALPSINEADTFLDGPGITIQWRPTGSLPWLLLSANAPRFTLRGLSLQVSYEAGTAGEGAATFIEVESADSPLISEVQIAGVDAASPVALTGIALFNTRGAFVHRCGLGLEESAPLHVGLYMVEGNSPRVLRSSFICRVAGENAALDQTSGLSGQIEQNTIVGGANGIKVENTQGVTLRQNSLIGPGSIGLYIHYSSDCLAADNRIAAYENAGILAKMSARTRLQRNLTSAIPGYAIFVEPDGGGVGMQGPSIDTYTPDDLELIGGCSCDAGSLIEVFVDPSNDTTRFIGEAVAGAGGAWSLALAEPLPPEHHFTATFTGRDGTTSSISEPEPALP